MDWLWDFCKEQYPPFGDADKQICGNYTIFMPLAVSAAIDSLFWRF